MLDYDARYPWISRSIKETLDEATRVYDTIDKMKEKAPQPRLFMAFPEHMRKNPGVIYSIEFESIDALGDSGTLDFIFSEN